MISTSLFPHNLHWRIFLFFFFTKMIVRAITAVLTSEEQIMNPTLYPRQRRTRPGNVFYCNYQGVRLSCLDSEHFHQCSQYFLFVSCFAVIGRAHNRRKTRHARFDQIRFGFAQTEVSFQWSIITYIKSFTSEYPQCLTSPPMLLDVLLYSLPHFCLYVVVYLLIVFVP